MGTISNAKATFGLTASVAPTAKEITGELTIGDIDVVSTDISTADIGYAFQLTSTGIGDVVTWTLTSGGLAKTTGNPNITRWGSQTSDTTGEDQEGVALPTMVTPYFLRIYSASGNIGVIDLVSGGDNDDLKIDSTIRDYNALVSLQDTSLYIFTFSSSGDSVVVTFIGESS